MVAMLVVPMVVLMVEMLEFVKVVPRVELMVVHLVAYLVDPKV